MRTRNIYLLLLMVLATVAGCSPNGSSDSTQSLITDSLSYESDSDSILTSKIVADFPAGQDTFALTVINYISSQLANNFLPILVGDENIKNFPRYRGDITNGQNIVNFYGKANLAYLQAQANEIRKYHDAEEDVRMSADIAIRKTYDCPAYTNYTTTTYNFLGGAHGSSSNYTVNILKPSGKILTQTVDTLQLEALQPLLRKGVLSYMHKNGDADVTDDNLNDVLFVDKGIIPLPAHAPFLTKDGLCFIYQQYEIGPYAMGMVTFTIPFDLAKPYMTQEAQVLLN